MVVCRQLYISVFLPQGMAMPIVRRLNYQSIDLYVCMDILYSSTSYSYLAPYTALLAAIWFTVKVNVSHTRIHFNTMAMHTSHSQTTILMQGIITSTQALIMIGLAT